MRKEEESKSLSAMGNRDTRRERNVDEAAGEKASIPSDSPATTRTRRAHRYFSYDMSMRNSGRKPSRRNVI